MVLTKHFKPEEKSTIEYVETKEAVQQSPNLLKSAVGAGILSKIAKKDEEEKKGEDNRIN